MAKSSRFVAISAASLCLAGSASAQAPAASILIFPRVVADGTADTLIQIANVSNRRTYLRCAYVTADGPAAAFTLVLVGQQPTHWVASRGRALEPDDAPCDRGSGRSDCDGAGLDPGRVPAVEPPFAGGLVCVQLDRSGAPLSGNALRGQATLSPGDGDAAAYDALGLRGFPENDADDVLCVEGLAIPGCVTAEYSACPREWRLLHAADGAPAPLDPNRRRVHGTLTALPCALALGGASPGLDLRVTSTDDLGQTFSATASLAPLAPSALAALSPILASDAGGAVRHTRLAADAGFALVAESERRLAGDDPAPAGRTASSAGGGAAGGAALITLPYLLVDAARGVDTTIQIANTGDEPLRAHCEYEATTPACDAGGPADSCLPGGPGCAGACQPIHTTTAIDLALAGEQTLAWRVGSGLTRAAEDGLAAVDVPAMGDAFLGLVRCLAVDAAGRPIDRNALAGMATLETLRAVGDDPRADHVDAAAYAAVGQAAVAGAVNGDAYLVLGGETPEYAPCADTLVLSHVFDGATVRLGTYAGTVGTTLALAPCAAELGGGEPAGVVTELLVYNEFGQRFSTSLSVRAQRVTTLSRIETSDPTRSIFSAGVAGTLAGQTHVHSVGGGVVGVAVQHLAGADPDRPHGAALTLQAEDERAELDVVALAAATCAGDCSGDGQVTVDELVRAVNVALGTYLVTECAAADADRDGAVGVDELIRAVGASLAGCPGGTRPTPAPIPTPTPTEPVTAAAPEVSYFGLVSGDDQPLVPLGVDSENRPVFAWPRGEGFGIVVEGRPGTTRRAVGRTAYVAGGAGMPDLQMIVDRDLGDGSAAICDADPPGAGGVPATAPFAFDAPNAVAAANDLGCRADDGNGAPEATQRAACTRLGRGFFNAASTTRFCLPVDRAWAFPSGGTVVAVRLRDVGGNVGPPREIVVRVP